jgi:hypothetical protein
MILKIRYKYPSFDRWLLSFKKYDNDYCQRFKVLKI